MADPYRQITDVRYTLIDLIDWLWRRSPLTADQAEQVTARLLGPVGVVPARLHAQSLYEATTDDRQPDFDRHAERAVSDLMHALGDAVHAEVRASVASSLRRLGLLHVDPLPQTPHSGVSPTTAQGEVTGSGGGSNAGPVTAGGDDDA